MIYVGFLVIIIFIFLFYYRSNKVVIEVVGKTIVDVEEELNSAEGQEKLHLATIRIRERLPPYISIFVSKRRLVDLIECMLTFLNKAFNIDKQVDIKGNETSTKITLNKGLTIEHTHYKEIESDDFIVYGKVKAETDFRHDTKATVEVGFKKRF